MTGRKTVTAYQPTAWRTWAPGQFIDGEWVRGSGAHAQQSIDPYREQVVAEVVTAGPEQVDAAVASARRSFVTWCRVEPDERAAAILRLADALERRRGLLVDLVVHEIGSPISLARGLQIDGMLEHLRWFAEAARRGPVGGYRSALPVHAGPPASSGMLLREPIGVVAALTPYNIPLVAAAWKVGAAIAAGCTAVLLPAPRAQLTGLQFAAAVEEAGLPPGLVNVVTGGPEVGVQLTSHPGVDMVTFTGSTAVGSAIMVQAAPTLKRLTLELGGKSPNIVLPGADIAAVVRPSVLRFTRNAGQGCGATTRTLVPRGKYDGYVDAVRAEFAALPVGDPAREETVIGPLISPEHRDRVEGYVARALEAGGHLEAGGGRPDLPVGWFMNAALIGRVGNQAEISRSELFGPVGVLIPYDTVDDAIALANDSDYGLNANVWGEHEEAVAVATQVRSGTVTVNGGGGLRPDAPFGGYRASGLGREAGEEGLAEFFEVKHIQWPAQ